MTETGKSMARAATETGSPPASFVPWSVPAALFLTLGVALSGWGLPLWTSLLPLTLLPLVFLGNTKDTWRLVALLSLLAPVGYVRYDLWAAQVNPLASLMGETQTFSGVSDGRYLTLDAPRGVRVALSPAGVVEAGRVRLEGKLVEAAGKRNPGGFDYRSYLRRRDVWAQLRVEEVLDFGPAAPSVRERLRRGVVAGLDERAAGLMQAMTLGLREDFRRLARDVRGFGFGAHLGLVGSPRRYLDGGARVFAAASGPGTLSAHDRAGAAFCRARRGLAERAARRRHGRGGAVVAVAGGAGGSSWARRWV